MMTAASQMAQTARRYLYEYGGTSEDFGLVSVSDRTYAATNPKAWFYQRPITLDDHQESRIISDPLHLFDCCQESDGAVALVVTSLERARDLPQPPVAILGAAQGLGPMYVSMAQAYRQRMTQLADTQEVADQLWRQSGLKPADMDVANIYDHFSPSVLMSLEALGFCGPGEAAAFIRDEGIGLDGRLPLNTNGGQLGEAYIHGFNGIAEAVRQLRGSAVNQVPNAEHAVVTSGSHVPTSGLVLSRA
jgi:acetyl-CoA acetyltransferase